MCVRACCDHQQGGRLKLRDGLRLHEEGAAGAKKEKRGKGKRGKGGGRKGKKKEGGGKGKEGAGSEESRGAAAGHVSMSNMAKKT